MFLFLLRQESNLDALKTAASHGTMEPPVTNRSDSSLARGRSSYDLSKTQLTFRLRIRDPLITKQSKQCLHHAERKAVYWVWFLAS